MPFVYANPGSGPSAGGIGWFDFGTLTLNPGQTVTGLTGTLNDGSTVTFDINLTSLSGAPRSLVATPVPTFPGSNFGVTGYTGMTANVALDSILTALPGVSTINISNIVVKDAGGNPITNYTAILADAERTNIGEVWNWATNGGGWKLLATLGPNPPLLVGLGTPSATITGQGIQSESAYVLTTQTPTGMVLTLTNGTSSRQAFSLGFATTKVTVRKNIGARIDSNDQFVLNIGGTPSDTATTAGAASGIQTQIADVWAIPGNPYVISEAMAAGSGSVLGDYTTVVSASNSTPAGSVPPVGALPITFTPALGDNVTYTILNAAPQSFNKRVDKAYADLGEVLTYTVTINNPNNFAINNVLMTDPLPAGTTYVGNLAVSAPYSGSTPMSGITINTIPANSFVTVSWQVQVTTAPPLTSPIANMAMVNVPGGTSGNSNVATTIVRHADLTSAGNFAKTVDKAFAAFGDTLTYTLTLHNTGNAAANNGAITDALPAVTTYVPGSITASVPFTGDPTGTITLTGPIAAGGTATVTFQVKLSATVPPVNPVPNTAAVKYAYTVDPTKPNGATAAGNSNTATTEVSTAKLVITKSTDKTIGYIGDIITYSFSIKNTGNVPANNVVLSDVLPNGTAYQPGSLIVSVPYTNVPPANIQLTNAIAPGETVSVSFQVKVVSLPVPNPLVNRGEADYTFTVNPNDPNGVSATSTSNAVSTTVFRYNFGQQITDLINSVALEEAALAAIANAEGAKIQAMVAMGDVTTQELLCLNKSVSDMVESISLLESVLKQKLSALNCQINGYCM